MKIYVGDVEEGTGYSVVKNDENTWLEITEGETEGILKPNTVIELSIKADLSKCSHSEGNGMIIFRLENGYSVPITVFCI